MSNSECVLVPSKIPFAFFDANFDQTEGVIKIIPLGKITEGEQSLIKAALPELVKNIETVCPIFFGVELWLIVSKFRVLTTFLTLTRLKSQDCRSSNELTENRLTVCNEEAVESLLLFVIPDFR